MSSKARGTGAVVLHKGSQDSILGGSWVVISGVISRITMVITYIRGLITPLLNYP